MESSGLGGSSLGRGSEWARSLALLVGGARSLRTILESKSLANRVYIVLPEVFGVNGWVRSVADRLAAHGHPALAVPLFARTAPGLELAYEPSDLAQGRRHKDATTTEQILGDVAAAVSWLGARYPRAAVHVVGFCFGGHAAFLAATLPGVEHAFDFYGAGVSRMRPGGGEPSLALLPEIQARLTCVFGTADPLIPSEDREAIGVALRQVDPAGQRLRWLEMPMPTTASCAKPAAASIPRLQPRDGACCLVTILRFSPGGWPPWLRWAWVVPEWCARPCWRLAPFPPSSPAVFCAG